MTASVLYSGQVQHQRLRPKQHHLRYSLFNLLLDLDDLPALSRRLWLFGFDRAGLVSFHQRDHGAGTADGLADWVRQQMRDAGLAADGAIRVLCMPRVLGHCFNPLSVYFCHDRHGRLIAMLYQVNNTFGQRHSYLIPVEERDDHGPIRQRCDKAFYVSPFMDMGLRYEFLVQRPAERVGVTVTVLDDQGGAVGRIIRGQASWFDRSCFIGCGVAGAVAGGESAGCDPLGGTEDLAQGDCVSPAPRAAAARGDDRDRSGDARMSGVSVGQARPIGRSGGWFLRRLMGRLQHGSLVVHPPSGPAISQYAAQPGPAGVLVLHRWRAVAAADVRGRCRICRSLYGR